jgi:hypothetical protein
VENRILVPPLFVDKFVLKKSEVSLEGNVGNGPASWASPRWSQRARRSSAVCAAEASVATMTRIAPRGVRAVVGRERSRFAPPPIRLLPTAGGPASAHRPVGGGATPSGQKPDARTGAKTLKVQLVQLVQDQRMPCRESGWSALSSRRTPPATCQALKPETRAGSKAHFASLWERKENVSVY